MNPTDILTRSLKEKRIDILFEPAKEFKSFPVIVPSYKNSRTDKKFTLQNLEKTGRKTYVFVYDFDYEKSGYDKMSLPSNAEFVILKDHPTGQGIPSLDYKMYRIHQWIAENNIPGFFKVDDDALFDQCYSVIADSERTPNGTIIRNKIPVSTVFDVMEMTVSGDLYSNWGAVLIPILRTNLLNCQFTEHLSKGWASTVGLYMVNGKLSKNALNDFNPSNTFGSHEFVVLSGLCLKYGFTPYKEIRMTLPYDQETGSILDNQNIVKWNNRMLDTARFFDNSIDFYAKESKDREYSLYIDCNGYIKNGKKTDKDVSEKFIAECKELKTTSDQLKCLLRYFPQARVKRIKKEEKPSQDLSSLFLTFSL